MMKNEEIIWTEGSMPVTKYPWFQLKMFGIVATVVHERTFASLHVSVPFKFEESKLSYRIHEHFVGEDMVQQAKDRGVRLVRENLIRKLEERRAASV